MKSFVSGTTRSSRGAGSYLEKLLNWSEVPSYVWRKFLALFTIAQSWPLNGSANSVPQLSCPFTVSFLSLFGSFG